MTGQHILAWQSDQSRRDIIIMKMELEELHARLARMPTKGDLAKIALGIIICSAGLVIVWIERVRSCL